MYAEGLHLSAFHCNRMTSDEQTGGLVCDTAC